MIARSYMNKIRAGLTPLNEGTYSEGSYIVAIQPGKKLFSHYQQVSVTVLSIKPNHLPTTIASGVIT